MLYSCFVIAYLVYGGHVSDSSDLEAVVGVTRACLRTPSATWGSGPHTLAHIISSSGHLGKNKSTVYVCVCHQWLNGRRTALWYS